MERNFYALKPGIKKIKLLLAILLVFSQLTALAADPITVTFETTGGTNEVCQGTTFAITGYAFGGTEDYVNYHWSAAPGMIFSSGFDDLVVFNTSFITAPADYTVTLTVTDADGNTGSGQIIITLKKTHRVTIFTDDPTTFCEGGSALLYADPSEGFSYKWRRNLVDIPDALESTYEALQSGSYRVRMTSDNGCAHTSNEIVITVNELPQVTASNDGPVCAGDDLQLTAGPDGAASYQWSSNTDPAFSSNEQNPLIPAISLQQAGTYTVTVTDTNGCSNSADTEVVVLPIPVAPESASADITEICSGEEGTITLTAAGGAGETLNWYSGSCEGTWVGSGSPLSIPYPETTTTYYASWASGDCGTSACVSVTITVSEGPEVVIETTDVSCQGANDGSATAIISGGQPPYDILWNTGSDQPTIENLEPGIYSVTVTDAAGCVSIAQVIIDEPEPIGITVLTQQNVSCYEAADGEVTVEATGGTEPYTYSWDNGQTGQTATGLAGGTYVVTVTDAEGCTGTLEVVITEPAPIDLQLTEITHVFCFGDTDGAATVQAFDGVEPYTYVWSDGQTGPVAENLGAGTYTVTVTDANGCQETLEVTINAPSEIIPVITDKEDVLCYGEETGYAIVQASGGTPGYSFLWSNGQTSYIAMNLGAGTYTVTITDSRGCTAETSVEIFEPEELVVNITDSEGAGCSGDNLGWALAEASGGTPDYSFLWSNGQTTPMATDLTPGTYTVEVTDLFGCTADASVTILEAEAPEVTITGVQHVSCFGGSDGEATAEVSGGTPDYSYLWSNGQTTPTATGLEAGLHTVTITDAAGCSVIAEIEINQPEALVISIDATEHVSCFGETDGLIQVSATGGTPGYSWEWNTGETTPTIGNLGAGTYTVTVTDANGCQETLEITITEPAELIAHAGEDASMCHPDNEGVVQLNGTAVGGTEPYSWSWSPAEGLSDAGIANPLATPGANTTYTLTVTDANGCQATSEVTISVTDPVVADAGDDLTICHPDNFGEAQLSVNATGGTGTFVYFWTANPEDPSLSGQENQQHITVSPAVNTEYTVLVTDQGGLGCATTATVNVNISEVLVVDAGDDMDVCHEAGGAGVQLQATATGGSGTVVTWQWSPAVGLDNPNIPNPVANPEVTTTYTVTITDSNGCVASSDVTLNVLPELFADAGPDVASCFGLPVMLGGIPAAYGGSGSGYTYQWSPAEGLDDPTAANPMVLAPTQTQVYTLTVTDSNGCVATDEVTISIAPQVVADAGMDQTVCTGTQITLGGSPTASGGQPPYLYYWWVNPNNPVSNQENPVVTVTQTTEFNLTVSDIYGCFSGASVLITVEQPVVADAGDDQTICQGETITLTATGGTAFLWSTGETTASIEVSPLETTTYTVNVSNTCGEDTVEVTVFVEEGQLVDLGNDIEICEGDVAIIDAGFDPELIYLWSDGSTGHSITVSEPGTYSVTVTHSVSGCFSSDEVEVSFLPAPVVDAGSDFTICLGEEVVIGPGNFEPSPASSYLWESNPHDASISDPTSTNPTVSPQVTTVYTLTETYIQTGCSAQATIVVEVLPLPEVTVAADMTICQGAEVNIGAGEPVEGYSYHWTSYPPGFESNEYNPLVSPQVTTVYTLTVENEDGCQASASITVEVTSGPQPVVADNILFCTANQVSPVYIGGDPIPGYTYEWTSLPAGFYSESANPMVFIGNETSVTYYLLVTDQWGCTGTDSVTVSVSDFLVTTSGSPTLCSDETTIQPGHFVQVSGGQQPYTYQWLNPYGEVISEAFSPTFDAPFEDYYLFTVTDEAGCILMTTVNVNLIPVPEVELTVSPAGAAFIGQTITFTALPAGYDNYEFLVDGLSVQTGASNVYVSNRLFNGQEVSVVVNNQGCYLMSPGALAVINDLPNAFTPDGDGINDIFGTGHHLVIFNRWGQTVFEGNEGWDGKHNGRDVAPGTYYYIMNVMDNNNRKTTLKGSVTVIRSRD
jgi:gliding motility-associated-like protein